MKRARDETSLDEMTPRRAARLAASLYVVCGALVGIGSVAFPRLHGENVVALFVLAILAILSGVAIWCFPWDRFGRSSTQWLLPPPFALIASFDAFTARGSYAYGVFFFVSFAWIGLMHKPGTALKFAPLAAVAYVFPLALQGRTAASIGTVAYVAPCWVLVGEAVAFVSARLVRSQDLLHERAVGSPERRPCEHNGIPIHHQLGAARLASLDTLARRGRQRVSRSIRGSWYSQRHPGRGQRRPPGLGAQCRA